MNQATGFQMRREGSAYCIYMIKADGREIPVDRQRVVTTKRNLTQAQAVCDSLNSGLLLSIASAVRFERSARKETE